jgi:hypothetical protein
LCLIIFSISNNSEAFTVLFSYYIAPVKSQLYYYVECGNFNETGEVNNSVCQCVREGETRALELTLQYTVLYLGIIFSCPLNSDAAVCRRICSKTNAITWL